MYLHPGERRGVRAMRAGHCRRGERPAKRIGAAEARWAHNPKVPRSKLGFAMHLVGWPSGPRR